ncbi:hypothetical protein D5086_011782 [Populus alba]|uniref:Uncharacterized protein n=1 Tax=Populus alba TaxID=43335 RepID=A0ACC4CFP1_POPAL
MCPKSSLPFPWISNEILMKLEKKDLSRERWHCQSVICAVYSAHLKEIAGNAIVIRRDFGRNLGLQSVGGGEKPAFLLQSTEVLEPSIQKIQEEMLRATLYIELATCMRALAAWIK